MRNRITSQAAILECSEAAVHSHPLPKISPENTGGRVLLLVKLPIDCSELRLYTKMVLSRMFSWKSSAWTVQTPVHSHPFSKISPENTGGRVLI